MKTSRDFRILAAIASFCASLTVLGAVLALFDSSSAGAEPVVSEAANLPAADERTRG